MEEVEVDAARFFLATAAVFSQLTKRIHCLIYIT
jgi:hypothetical protein